MTQETVLSFFFASLALTIAPGPDVMYILSTSIAKGKQYGIAAAIGFSSGLLFHTTLLVFGISTIIVESPMLFFLALFPTFINSQAGSIKLQVYTLGMISFLQAFAVFCVYAVLAASLTKFLRESTTFNTILKWLQIIVFATLAVFMVL